MMVIGENDCYCFKIKEVSGGQSLIFTQEMIDYMEANPYTHNIYVERRFMLT